MSDEQAARAKQQLYEDTSARDELIDDEAAVLLQWGEAQITELAARGLDDAAFEDAFAHLRGVMKNINRYTGQRAYRSAEEMTAVLDELAAEAQALGVDIHAAQLAVPSAQAADDNIALIHALTALVSPAQAQTAGAEAVSAEEPMPPQPPADPEPGDAGTGDAPDEPGFFDRLRKLF